MLADVVFAHSLADVLPCEDHVAGPTPEATDVPLFLQGEERLTLLDLVSTPSTVWKGSVRGRGRKMSRRRDEGGQGNDAAGTKKEM